MCWGGRCAPAAPCETQGSAPSLPSSWPPLSLRRPRTKRGPKQWLALRAEWLRRSSTNPPPSLTETEPALVRLKRGRPSLQRSNEHCLGIKHIYKKKIQGEKSAQETNHANCARKEPVLRPVSPLFITDRVYTIQASARFSALNLTFTSSCQLYLRLQAC